MHVPRTVHSPSVCSYPFIFTAGCHICVFGGQSLTDVAVTNELFMLDTSAYNKFCTHARTSVCLT
jgi:hypothetical protein